MSNTKVGTILGRLLSEHNLKVTELARRIKIPQPTVQRIVTGTSENPQMSSLKSIAEYFDITVDQLKGIEPIPKFDNVYKLPLISWEDATLWHKKFTTTSHEHIIADLSVSKHAYALKILDGAMEPIFPCNSILIVDPNVQPKDRSYVIALIQGSKHPIFRQLIINGADKYLKPLSPDTEVYKMLQLKSTDTILGTVVQARWNYTP
jgi:SOS-response transcriptional repressor LexA